MLTVLCRRRPGRHHGDNADDDGADHGAHHSDAHHNNDNHNDNADHNADNLPDIFFQADSKVLFEADWATQGTFGSIPDSLVVPATLNPLLRAVNMSLCFP